MNLLEDLRGSAISEDYEVYVSEEIQMGGGGVIPPLLKKPWKVPIH
jgi:hypothetical protein